MLFFPVRLSVTAPGTSKQSREHGERTLQEHEITTNLVREDPPHYAPSLVLSHFAHHILLTLQQVTLLLWKYYILYKTLLFVLVSLDIYIADAVLKPQTDHLRQRQSWKEEWDVLCLCSRDVA